MFSKKVRMRGSGSSGVSGRPKASVPKNVYPMKNSGYIPTSSPFRKPQPRRRSRSSLPVRVSSKSATASPTVSCTEPNR